MRRLVAFCLVTLWPTVASTQSNNNNVGSSQQTIVAYVQVIEVSPAKARGLGLGESLPSFGANNHKPGRTVKAAVVEHDSPLLEALNSWEAQGAAAVVSEPTLVTRSGMQAQVTVGKTVSLAATGHALQPGGPKTTFVGTTVDLTPAIERNGRIRLAVRLEQSALSNSEEGNQNSRMVGMTTHGITAEAALEPGKTLAVSGLTKNRVMRKSVPAADGQATVQRVTEEIETLLLVRLELVDPVAFADGKHDEMAQGGWRGKDQR
jgi:type II secretory pathway component GspD/PulD (secretin)